jgi:hypothetical protein
MNEPMIALDGPFEGKLYVGVSEETKTLIDNYRTLYEFYSVTYERTDKGWKFVKEEPLLSTLVGVEK